MPGNLDRELRFGLSNSLQKNPDFDLGEASMTTGNRALGLIAIMGSGELTKSMLPVHRRLLER